MFSVIQKYPKQIDAAILILGFIIGANLFIFFKKSGIDQESFIRLFSNRGFHPLIPTLAGLVIGVTFYLLEFRYFRRLRKVGFFWVFLSKLTVFSVVIVLSSVAVQVITSVAMGNATALAALKQAVEFIGTDIFFSLYVYLLLLGITLNFFRELGNQFGHGIIIKYLSGRYREPVEENRVFMFIDLNSSTTIAERLGHVRYSRLLNKCFADLSEVLP